MPELTILAFAGSNSSTSINKQLVSYAARLLEGVEIKLLDLNDYEVPIYSLDREKSSGIPGPILAFKETIRNCDGILISLAEHNGAYSTAFKNLYDWLSRIDRKVWCDKPILLMGAAPGGRGAKSVIELAKIRFTRINDNFLDTFSLPKFGENFSAAQGILDPALNKKLLEKLKGFQIHISKDSASDTEMLPL